MWNVLIADDHLVDRRLLKGFLKGRADCQEAADGNEAILCYNFSLHEQTPYDLIIIDLTMPKMTGQEVLRRIREDEKKRGVTSGMRVPVIATSAMDEVELASDLKLFDGFFEKPVNPKELLKKIESLVKPKK